MKYIWDRTIQEWIIPKNKFEILMAPYPANYRNPTGGLVPPGAAAFHPNQYPIGWVSTTGILGSVTVVPGAWSLGFGPGVLYGNRCVYPTEPYKPKKSESIETGELIGYRAWRWQPPCLVSISSAYVWDYDEPAGGDSLTASGGIYSFKEYKTLNIEVNNGHSKTCCWVLGSIYIYGEVIEHATGYRAEFAKIRSLNKLFPSRLSNPYKLNQIRNLYHVENVK